MKYFLLRVYGISPGEVTCSVQRFCLQSTAQQPLLASLTKTRKKVLCTQSPLQDQSIRTQGYRPAEQKYIPWALQHLTASVYVWCKGQGVTVLPQGHRGIISLEDVSLWIREAQPPQTEAATTCIMRCPLTLSWIISL